MTEQFTVTYQYSSGAYSEIIVIASDEDTAADWFKQRFQDRKFIGIRKTDDRKPGRSCYTVPGTRMD